MTFNEFKKALTRKFKFNKDGFFVGEGNKTMLAFPRDEGCNIEVIRFNVIPIADTNLHFKASAILDAPVTDEVVHVLEPGKYFDHVFWNDHEYGLYSIDCIEDYEEEIDIDEYKTLSKDKRIEQMPFFENLLAPSLQAFFDGICAMTNDE